MGRYVAAFALDELSKGNTKPLWQRDDFLARAHNGLRVTDLNGYGRDEIISGCILAPDGNEIFRLPNVRGHLDSIFIADVRPADRTEKGVEVIFAIHEELIVLSDNELHLCQNKAPNPNPKRLRLWTQ